MSFATVVSLYAVKFCSIYVFDSFGAFFCTNNFLLSEIYSFSKCSGFVLVREKEHQREH